MDRDSTLYGTPGSGRNSTIMSPASRNIEKSLNELDDLINKRRLELSNLRSNNRVFSADKMLQEGLDKTTPPMNHIGTNHIHTSSSSSSIRSNTINSNISPYLASTIPNASISNNGTSPSYSPYGSVTAPDRVMGSAYNTRPPLYTSPMPYGGNNYSNEFSRNTGLAVDSRNTGSMPSSGNHYGHGRDNQDMMTISNTKYNELENQLQYFQNKVKELELEKQVTAEELTSTKDDLLFLRTQLQTKSDEIADLKEAENNLKNEIQTLQALHAQSNGDHSYKLYYEDAVKENELWAQKVEEIEKEKRILEDDLKRAEKAIFDWEAGWGQLEGDCIALQDQLRQKDLIISSLNAKKSRSLEVCYGTLRKSWCRQVFNAWKQNTSNKKKSLQFISPSNTVENSSVEGSGLRRRNKPEVKEEDASIKPYRLPASDSAEQLQQQLQFVHEESRTKHNISYLVILAFFQFIIWVIVVVFGYIYLEKNSGVDVRELLQGYSLTWGSKTYEANEVIDTFKSYF